MIKGVPPQRIEFSSGRLPGRAEGGRPGSNLNRDYASALNRNAASRNWFRYLTEKVPEKLSRLSEGEISAAIISALCEDRRSLRESDFQSAGVGFEADPEIEHIVGQRVALPVVSFLHISFYSGVVRQLGFEGIPKGVLTPVSFEKFLSRIGINIPPGQEIRPLHVVVYYETPLLMLDPPLSMLDPPWPPWQMIRKHELVHAIDPLIHSRREADELILAEMIATIGEGASQERDNYVVKKPKDFWLWYLEKCRDVTQDFLRVLKVDPSGQRTSKNLLAERMVKLVHDLTMMASNTELTRILMRCENFAEVYAEFEKKFSRYYSSVEP